MRSLIDLQPQLQQLLCERLDEPVEIQELQQVFGGASRQTWLMALKTGSGARRLVIRRTQPSALIETEQEVESGAMRAFADSPVPVPRVLMTASAGSDAAARLDSPFLLVEALPGAASSPFDQNPYDPHRQPIGEQFWRTLGQIAGNRAAAGAFAEFSPAPEPEACWQVELDKWQKVIRQDSLGPEPVLEAALRWLRAHPPPPASALVPVHGDYRSGNFLHEDGRITAVLDWEMAHLGDPLEDVAWAATPLWSQHAPDRPGALLPREQGFEIWSEHSGFAIDPEALRWWEVFAAVKGMAIWISAGHEFASGSNEQPINLFSSWICSDMHLQTLIWLLAPEGTPGAEKPV